MFEQLLSLSKKAQKLNLDFIMKALSKDKSLINMIIELNTIEQLYNKGINSQGINLERIGGHYSEVTVFGDASRGIKGKLAKNQPVDRVTLKDTGAFYKSWKVFLDSSNDFEITNDPIKDGENILDRWGKQVIGLTDESQSKFNEEVKKRISNIVLEFMLT